VETLAGNAPGWRYHFSLERGDFPGGYLRDGVLTLSLDGKEEDPLLSTDELPLLGRHNVANALAGALGARLAGAEPAAIAGGLRSFRSLPHRLEPVSETDGIRWVNDSKATNVAAACGALQSLQGPLVLLLGGKDKGEDFRPLREALHSGVRAAVVYGQVRARLGEALRGTVPLDVVDGSFGEAVAVARARTEAGDTLLLSPACSSFDMFESYEARGFRFAALARGEA